MIVNKIDIDSKELRYYNVNPVNSSGKEYLNIPVELIKHVIETKTINQLKAFICLKDLTSGHFLLNRDSVEQFSKRIEITPKTFKKNVSWLLGHHLIVLNSKTGNYRVISFSQLSHKLKLSSRTGAIFYTTDYKKFRGFSYAAVITYYMKVRNRINYKKFWDTVKPARKKGRASMSLTPNIFNLPHAYLAEVLNTSKNNAVKYRMAAIRDGYIIAEKVYSKFNLNVDDVDLFKKYADIQEINNSAVVRKGNSVYMQQADNLISKITLRTKRDLPTLRKKRHR